MQKINSLFFLILLTLNIITSMKLNSIDSLMPSKGLHNRLMDILVQVQIQDSPKTVDDISKAILDMLKELKDNQASHEEINKKMMAQCLDEENFRRKEVADATSAVTASSSALAKCQTSLQAAQNNLPALTAALAEMQANLASKTNERNKQKELYVQRSKDWAEAIAFINEFIVQVDNKLGKTSFADLGEKLLRHVSKLGRMRDAVAVFVALAQDSNELASEPGKASNYSYQAQTKTIDTLKTHLKALLNKLVTDSKQNDVEEANAQAAFEKLKAELLSLIAKLKDDIAKTEAQILSMRECVANETKIMAIANNKLSRNGKLMSLAGQTCTDFTHEFISATKNRLSEMQVIEDILVIMKKRFGELPADLVSYLTATKAQFTVYVNSTVFKKYEEYVQSHTADNTKGADLVKVTK